MSTNKTSTLEAYYIYTSGRNDDIRSTLRQLLEQHPVERLRIRCKGAKYVIETDAPVYVGQ